MVEVQDKTAGLISSSDAKLGSPGSVPIVLPDLVAAMAPAAPMLARTLQRLASELTSFVLIVVMPTVFWCGTINGVRSLFGLNTSTTALSCLALVIAGFLLMIRASLMIDRSS
jgi:hypothetical protein